MMDYSTTTTTSTTTTNIATKSRTRNSRTVHPRMNSKSSSENIKFARGWSSSSNRKDTSKSWRMNNNIQINSKRMSLIQKVTIGVIFFSCGIGMIVDANAVIGNAARGGRVLQEGQAIGKASRATNPIQFPTEGSVHHDSNTLDSQRNVEDRIIHRDFFPGGSTTGEVTNARTGRVMTTGSGKSNNNSTLRDSRESTSKTSAESSKEGESRKAAPDVQDIIDGIVKLLGGKVHNGPPPLTNQGQPLGQFHQGQGQQRPQQMQPPPVSQNPAYNLFNPAKPLFYQTSKPTRINNRGPPLPISNGGILPQSNENYNSPNPTSGQDSSFEAIPLEALNTDFDINKSNFGPPFPLNKNTPQRAEAPYKQGVPLPEQLVPPNNAGGYTNNRYESPLNGNNNQRLPPTVRPFENFNNYNYNNNNNYNSNSNYGSGNGNRVPPRTTPGSLLVPVTTGRPKQSVVTFPEEDDEADDLRFTTILNVDLKNDYKTDYSTSNPLEDSSPPRLYGENAPPKVPLHDLGSAESGPNLHLQPSTSSPSSSEINPTRASDLGLDSVYPTLVLETNSDSGFVEIKTRYSTLPASQRPGGSVVPSSSSGSNIATGPSRPPVYYPESNLNKQVHDYNFNHPSSPSPSGSSEEGSKVMTPMSSSTTALAPLNPVTSINSLPTPPLRPGIVISDVPNPNSNGGGQGVGSVEVVTAGDGQLALGEGVGQVGEVFDVTVTAKQSYGGQTIGQPFIVPDYKDEVITAPQGNQQFVSIDGKRTYFNLHQSTPTVPLLAGAVSRPTQTVTGTVLPVLETTTKNYPGIGGSSSVPKDKKPNQSIGVGSVGAPVPLLPQSPGKTLFNSNVPVRPVSTSLSISPGGSHGSPGDKGIISIGSGGNKTPPNIIRRPLTRRPSVPPVRIDTCIVGDDSTCNSEQFEVCRTENGVSSCVCRAGYARRRHRDSCKAIVSLVMSIKLDKLGDKKLNYDPDYFNPNSETYQNIEWETIHALDSSMGETTLSGGYIGSKLDAIGFDGKHAVVNTTVLIQENHKMPSSQLKRELQKQMIQVLTRNRNNFGKSQLWVEGPISAVSAITDLDECLDSDTNDCHSKAQCVNTLGSFECKCEPGYGDAYENDKKRSGRKCETCSGKSYCNGRGDCLIENGQRVCRCAGNYYGSQCDIDGEVLAVAIGASISAIVIIGLTLACLCMWSRKWKKEEQKAALMSRTLFGGMATQALSYLGGKSTNPYQQHIAMDERLRWAQVQDPNLTGNIYVQNEAMNMHSSPAMIGQSMMETPPMMAARRSAETVDSTEDIYGERQTVKRPRSRSSQMQGGIYYDLEPEQCQSDIYASRSMMHYPAQYCVPMTPMGHYGHTTRGFYS